MKIGITERGDAGLDFLWYEKLKHHAVDGVILITKNISDRFIEKVMEVYKSGFTQIIVHCTCTGWGGTMIEPNVPDFHTQLLNLRRLIKAGFPKENCVLRIDPIIPTEKGIKRVKVLLETAYEMHLLPDMRIRISVLDEYRHVKERIRATGHEPFYSNGCFQAPKKMMGNVVTALSTYDLQFDCCAENLLNHENQFIHTGCISEQDLQIMGLPFEEQRVNPQNRNGCKCLACKTELLTECKQCPHKCIYCYWKN